jgi:hypothetical protein
MLLEYKNTKSIVIAVATKYAPLKLINSEIEINNVVKWMNCLLIEDFDKEKCHKS